MTEQARGCHHCIGAAVTVTNLIFSFIHSKAIANDGLSPNEISELRTLFLESYASGLDLFEKIHLDCTTASRNPKSGLLSRETILPLLIRACGQRAAESAFIIELDACGAEWLDEFFFGFTGYLRSQLADDVEYELISAFVDSAGKHKSALTTSKLLREPKAQVVVEKCIEIFRGDKACEDAAESISSHVNEYIAELRTIAGPHAAKTTKEEIRRFLELLPREAALVIEASRSEASSDGHRSRTAPRSSEA